MCGKKRFCITWVDLSGIDRPHVFSPSKMVIASYDEMSAIDMFYGMVGEKVRILKVEMIPVYQPVVQVV